MVRQCSPWLLCVSKLRHEHFTTTNDEVYRHPLCQRVCSFQDLTGRILEPCSSPGSCYIQSGDPTCSKTVPSKSGYMTCHEEPLTMSGPIDDPAYVIKTVAHSFYGNPFLGPPYDPSYSYRHRTGPQSIACQQSVTRYGSLAGASTQYRDNYRLGRTAKHTPQQELLLSCPIRFPSKST